MIAKGIITDEEFNAQLGAERANYLSVLKRLTEERRSRQLLRNGSLVGLFCSTLGLPDLLILFWRCFFVAT